MDSYEIARKAIKFENPKRIPFNFGIIGHSDFISLGYGPPQDWKSPRPSELQEIDEWGCTWEKCGLEDKTMGQCVVHPLSSLNNLREYRWPDPDSAGRFNHIKEALERAKDKFVLAGINGILQRARFLRGFSNLMQDFYLQPKEVHELLERILDFFLGILHNYAKFKRIHGISMPEDWGTQYSTFISPPMFREFFKPIYKKLFDTVHSYGWIMRMHSDGKINDFIEEFINWGLDVIELEQPRALGIEEIGQRYRGRICFEGSIDIQATLPKGDREAIKEEAKLLLENWSTPKGGFIAVCYHGSDIGVSDEIIRIAFDAFQEYGNLFLKNNPC